MKHLAITFSLLLVTGLGLAPIIGHSKPTEDLRINADNQDLDYKNNTIHFMGNVEVEQGDMTITANELYVISATETGQKLIAKGEPAYFSQQKPNEEKITAEAEEITYLVDSRILKLKGKAKFHQGGSMMESNQIEFNLNESRVKADGDKATGGRVTTIIKTNPVTQPDNSQGTTP